MSGDGVGVIGDGVGVIGDGVGVCACVGDCMRQKNISSGFVVSQGVFCGRDNSKCLCHRKEGKAPAHSESPAGIVM